MSRPSRRRWLAVAALCVAACTSAEERYAWHVERAESYLEQDQIKEAMLEFQSALRLQPENAGLYERIGDTLFARSRQEQALHYYQEAVRLDPSRIGAAMMEARLVARQDRERARELLARGLAEAPELAIVQRTRAHLGVLENDLDDALAAARRAVETDPDDFENWAELVEVQEARIRARQKRRLPPEPEIFEAALAALDRVDELKGGFPRARLSKARLLASWPERRDEARAVYENALALALEQGDPREVRFAAAALDRFGALVSDPELRRRALAELVRVDEDNYAAWEDLARLVDSRRQGQRGEEIHLRLLERRPGDPRAHALYAGFLVRKGRSDDADAHLRRAIADGVDDPLLWETLMRLQIGAGRLAQARAVQAALAERYPGAWETRLGRARLALAIGRVDEAAELLAKLVSADGSNVDARLLLGFAELRRGRSAAARRELERAEQIAPDGHAPALRLRARIAVADEEWTEAVRVFQALHTLGHTLSPDEKIVLARALHGADSSNAAREVLEELLADDAARPAAAVAFAELLGDSDPERTREVLEAAHESAPASPGVVAQLTRLDRAQGHGEAALERLNRLVAARLAGPELLLLRARLLTDAGRLDDAESDVLRAFEAQPMLPGAIEMLYSLYQRQGRIKEAVRSFEQAEEAGVLHAGARLLLARLYVARRRLDLARATLETVIEEQPELWQARNELARILATQRRDLDRALVLARQAHAESDGRPETLDTLGFVHLRAGRPRQGVREFQRAIRAHESQTDELNPTFVYHLGLGLTALGRYDEAARAFERALSAGEFPEARDAQRQLETARHLQARRTS